MEYIYVDSRTRDTSAYPNGNTYTLYLQNHIKNIYRIDLINAVVPNSMFNYTGTSSATFLTANSTAIKLYPGFYSASSLVAELSNNTAFTGAPVSLSITYNTADGKFIISGASSTFTITPGSQQVATILGLPNSQVTSALGSAGDYPNNSTYQSIQIIKSSSVADFTANEMVFLDIAELRTNKMNSSGQLVSVKDKTITSLTVDGNASNKSFACIPMDVVSGSIKVFKEHTDYLISIVYPQMIEKLSRLTINWIDVFGNSIIFNGANNNSFILRVYTKNIVDDKRLTSIPEPVSMAPEKNIYLIVFLIIGLLTIILMKKGRG
jgi:hypothetical protein